MLAISSTVNAIPMQLYIVFVFFSIATFIGALASNRGVLSLVSLILNFITGFLTPIAAEVKALSTDITVVYYPISTVLMFLFFTLAVLSAGKFLYDMFVAPVGE